MEALLQFVQTHFPILLEHKYTFLFLGSAIEGLSTLVLAGFLYSIGSIDIFPTGLVITSGYIVNGFLWYSVGYFAGAKPIDKWVRNDKKGRVIIDRVQEYFERYSGRAIIITKFTFSLTIATMIMAGSLKYNIRKFALYNFIASVGWVTLALSVGYFFGASYKFFLSYIKHFVYFLLFFGGAVALLFGVKKLMESAFIKSLIISEKMRELGERLKTEIDKLLAPNKEPKE